MTDENRKRVFAIEGIGVCEAGPDGSSFDFPEQPYRYASAGSIGKHLDIELLDCPTYLSGFREFRSEAEDDALLSTPEPPWPGDVEMESPAWRAGVAAHNAWLQARFRRDYREDVGRPFPRAYRLRIVVEAEELSDAETEAWWRSLAAKHER